MANHINCSGIDADDAPVPLPGSPSRNILPTDEAQHQHVTTELVVIQSSIPKAGPHPRVFKQKNSLYMLPRSPKSPTLPRNTAAIAQLSRRKDYAPVSVSDIVVEAFSLGSGRWSPAFPTQAERAMDPRQALAFNPREECTSSFSKLRSLDLFPALGLAASDFWPLFSRCLICHNLMTTRTAPYHICQNGGEVAEDCTDAMTSTRHFLQLLDAHNIGRKYGVSEDIFKSIFYACNLCGRYVTNRMAFNHHDGETGEDTDADSFGLESECLYLRMEYKDTEGCLSAHKYQKMHCLDTSTLFNF